MTQSLKIECIVGDISQSGEVASILVTKEQLDSSLADKASLVNGKIPDTQLPAFIATSFQSVNQSISSLTTTVGNNLQIAKDYAEAYTDEKLIVKADLVDGKVPQTQLPSVEQYEGLSEALNGVLDQARRDMIERTDQIQRSKADLGEDGKVVREQLPNYDKIPGLETVVRDLYDNKVDIAEVFTKSETLDVAGIEATVERIAPTRTEVDTALMMSEVVQVHGFEQKYIYAGGYPFGAVLTLDDGITQVKSTVANNKNNPNSNVVGWIPHGVGKFITGMSYGLNAEVILSNGDVVKSTVSNNTSNPNVDVTGWVKTNDASQIYDGIHSQKQINDNNRVNNVKQFGAVGTTGLVSDWHTFGSENYRKYKDIAAVKVDYPFITDGTESIDYAAFQATVNFAISNGSNRIFIPFDNAEKYFINRTVTIPASGFMIDGDSRARYNPQDNGGYIFADENVDVLFNYGVGQALPSNQFRVNGVALLSTTGYTQNAFKIDANNNGPHRGMVFSNTCAKGFADVIQLSTTNPTYLSAANVVIESGCVFSGNTNLVNAVTRLFGLCMQGIQAEQGARIKGFVDGGVSIRDCMLEGQSDVIDISANTPQIILENNYMEKTLGRFFIRARGTNTNALFEERSNLISSISSVDCYLMEGVIRVKQDFEYNHRNDRFSLYTFNDLVMGFGSKIRGSVYVATDPSEPTHGFTGYCVPETLKQARPTATTLKALGTDKLKTPFGDTSTGVVVTGTGGYLTLNKSWDAGDIVTVTALVRVNSAVSPNMQIYNQDFVGMRGVGGLTVPFSMVGEWQVMVFSRPATVAGTAVKVRFVMGSASIDVAAIGVDITKAADFKTFNGVQRAEVQVFNPLPLNSETQTYRDVRTLTIPAIATGLDYKPTGISVFGVAVGDAVICSPNVDMQGLDWFARVSAANTIELRIVNRTSASVTLGAVQWNTRVFK